MPSTSQFVGASGAMRTVVASAPEMATEWTRTNSLEHLLMHRVFVLNLIYYPINYIDLANVYNLFLVLYNCSLSLIGRILDKTLIFI